MKVFAVKAQGLSLLPSSYHSTRFRSPPVDMSSCSFNRRWPKIGIQLSNQQEHMKHINCLSKRLRTFSGNNTPIAPLQLNSPSGQILWQMIGLHPHLLPSAIDKQLQLLQEADHVDDKCESLQEIIYCLVVQKFVDNDISLIATGLQMDSSHDFQEQKLKKVHSADALSMIDGHLVFTQTFVGKVNKTRLMKLYAKSVGFGYYLKRVDERFQLEKTMNTLLPVSDPKPDSFWDLESMVLCDDGLGSYVLNFDVDTLQTFATIRSEEVKLLIEKQEEALFSESDELISISSCEMSMLVLEAVAFGSFLWEAECYVETKCQLLIT